MPKKMFRANLPEYHQWTDEDVMAIKRAWKQGHLTPASVRDACGFELELSKIKTKLQQLQRGGPPVLVKGITPGRYIPVLHSGRVLTPRKRNLSLRESFSQTQRTMRCFVPCTPESRKSPRDRGSQSMMYSVMMMTVSYHHHLPRGSQPASLSLPSNVKAWRPFGLPRTRTPYR